MHLQVTHEAAEVLRRSLEFGKLDPETHGVRLRVATALGGGRDVQVELAAEPVAGDAVIEAHGVTLYVDPEVSQLYPEAVVAVEPQHERVVVRAAGTDR